MEVSQLLEKAAWQYNCSFLSRRSRKCETEDYTGVILFEGGEMHLISTTCLTPDTWQTHNVGREGGKRKETGRVLSTQSLLLM